MPGVRQQSNFSQLKAHDVQLERLGLLAERGYGKAHKPEDYLRELTNQDIAARIVGYIRQTAIGEPLLPYSECVDWALQHLLAHPLGPTSWTIPQCDWLKRIAAQTKANVLVDRAALDDPDLIFKREGGGFSRPGKLFNARLQPVLDAFNDALWAALPESAQR